MASLAINPNTVLKASPELETKGCTAGRLGRSTFIEDHSARSHCLNGRLFGAPPSVGWPVPIRRVSARTGP